MYPDPSAVDPQAFAAVIMGFRVNRPTAVLPQTAHAPLFTVAGGRILLLSLIGEVTTIIQNQANNTKITAYPAAGTAVDLCAVVSTANLEVGGKLVLPAAFATALAKTLAGAAILQPNLIVVAPGTIDLDCAASNTGAVKWSAFYVPFDDGATLVAA
jgi:hypothetical protein